MFKVNIFDVLAAIAALVLVILSANACVSTTAGDPTSPLPTVLRIDGEHRVVQVTWAKEPTCLLQSHGKHYVSVPCPGDVK